MPKSIEDPNIEQLFHNFLGRLYDKSLVDLVITYLREAGIWGVPYTLFDTHDEYYKFKLACVLLANNPKILSKLEFNASSVDAEMFEAIVINKCTRTLKYLFEKFPGYSWWTYKTGMSKYVSSFDSNDMPLFKLLISHGFIREIYKMEDAGMFDDYEILDITYDLTRDWVCTPRSLKWCMKKYYISHVHSKPFYFNDYNKEIDVLL